MAQTVGVDLLLPFLPYMVVMSIPLAFGKFMLALRPGKSLALCAFLSVVPVFNFFFWACIWYYVATRVRDLFAYISICISL